MAKKELMARGRRLHQSFRRGETELLDQSEYMAHRNYVFEVCRRWHRRIACCQSCPPRNVRCAGAGLYCQAMVQAFEILDSWGMSYGQK